MAFGLTIVRDRSKKKVRIQKLDTKDELSEEFQKHDDIEILEFSTCFFTKETAKQVNELQNLKRLHMFNCWVDKKDTTLLMSQNSFKNLQVLELERCKLETLPPPVLQMTLLQELSTSGNDKLNDLPQELVKLTHLQKLNLSACDFRTIPLAVTGLSQLKDLRLWGNESLKVLPKTMSGLKELEYLDISSCGFDVFPNIVTKLASLKELHGQLNNFKAIPQSLARLKNLKVFNIRGCHQLVDYPGVVFSMPNLKTVTVYRPRSLPTDPSKIMDLEVLSLAWYSADVNLQEDDDPDVDLIPQKLYMVPNFVPRMKHLKTLYLDQNRTLKYLPSSLTQLKQLEHLHVSFCGLEEFPLVVLKMTWLLSLNLDENPLTILPESVVKYWHEESFQFPEFLSKWKIDLSFRLKTPPFETFKKGSKECYDFYGWTKVSSLVDCSLFGVQILGKTEAGKSSLIHSMNGMIPTLMGQAERTVVSDTIQVKDGNTLLQITDFGGHSIYELTCPLFLKTRNQLTLVAVKLREYSQETHDELVSKWLSTALSCVDKRYVAIVATQIDLCDEEEIQEKSQLLEKNVTAWVEKEHRFKMKIGNQESSVAEPQIFLTSSATLEGLGKLREFLFRQARANKISIPKHWSKTYRKLQDIKGEAKKFLTLSEVQTFFKQSIPLTSVFKQRKADFEQCLDFLHSTGMILWYRNNEVLRDVVFHNMSAIVQVLQGLFRHNICEYLPYDDEKHKKFITTKIEFDTELSAFHQTGILTKNLLHCIWQTIGLREQQFEALSQIITQMELCYADDETTKESQEPKRKHLLRFPWFVNRQDLEGIVTKQWPDDLPLNTIQFSLFYNFFNRVPSTIYERLCVRIQKHLVPGAHFRYDFKDFVFVLQDDVKLLLKRCADEVVDPSIQIHLRCPITRLKFHHLLLKVYRDMEALCADLPGVVVDAYFLCPHCVLARLPDPRKRPVNQLGESSSNRLDMVPCDPKVLDGPQIPAAIIFPSLLESEQCDYHTKKIQNFCISLLEKYHPAIPEGVLLNVAQRVTKSIDLSLIGAMLGVKEYTIDSILNDYNKINEATYRVLLHWRQQRMDEGKEGEEMKVELRNVLCSREVGMNSTVGELDYFQAERR